MNSKHILFTALTATSLIINIAGAASATPRPNPVQNGNSGAPVISGSSSQAGSYSRSGASSTGIQTNLQDTNQYSNQHQQLTGEQSTTVTNSVNPVSGAAARSGDSNSNAIGNGGDGGNGGNGGNGGASNAIGNGGNGGNGGASNAIGNGGASNANGGTSYATGGSVRSNYNFWYFQPATVPQINVTTGTFTFQGYSGDFVQCPTPGHGFGVSIYVAAYNENNTSAEVSKFCEGVVGYVQNMSRVAGIATLIPALPADQQGYAATQAVTYLFNGLGVQYNPTAPKTGDAKRTIILVPNTSGGGNQ